MKISMSRMLIALSSALDVIEGEVNGATRGHAKRVAIISLNLGREFGLHPERLAQLAVAAVMHDNAVSQEVALLRAEGNEHRYSRLISEHCSLGEKNMEIFPFYEHVHGAVLYHHENADGSGPFGLESDRTPLFAQIIHLANRVDTFESTRPFSRQKYESLTTHVRQVKGVVFSDELADAFLKTHSYEVLAQLQQEDLSAQILNSTPLYSLEYDNRTIRDLAAMFARITDYKSHYTCMHSLGIAGKAEQMGKYYGESSEMCTKLYLAGALHDIGKLTVPNTILEKPDALTGEEFRTMKSHVQASWEILSGMEEIPDVVHWACNHHEKLDGTGYPNGRTGDELDRYDRLLACIDIFQALTEQRSYKGGLDWSESIVIMEEMAKAGEIDAEITEDIRKCFIEKRV